MFLYNCVNNKGHILRLSGVFVPYTYANRTYSNAGQDSWGLKNIQFLKVYTLKYRFAQTCSTVITSYMFAFFT